MLLGIFCTTIYFWSNNKSFILFQNFDMYLSKYYLFVNKVWSLPKSSIKWLLIIVSVQSGWKWPYPASKFIFNFAIINFIRMVALLYPDISNFTFKNVKNLKCKIFSIDFLDEIGNFKQKNFYTSKCKIFLHFTTTDPISK